MSALRRNVTIMTALMMGVFFHIRSDGQDTPEFFPSETDTTYIEDFKHLLTTRYYILAQNARMTVFPAPDASMVYEPNESARLGLAGFYKWFGLGLSYGGRLFRKDPDVYGSTTEYDFRVNAYGRFFVMEGYLQYYKGFYMNYKSDDWNETFIIPGMQLISVGIDALYIYNYARFSIRASFIQTERQKKSAGSLLVRPVLRYYNVHSDTGIIPSRVLGIYSPKQENILSGDFFTVGLGPGYTYTFVLLKNFYITAGAAMEVNWNFCNYTTTEQRYHTNRFSFPLSIRAAIGYNSGKWFIGASYLSTIFYFRPETEGRESFNYNLTQVRFWVGTRFNAFKKRNQKK